jgi:hypothetical protein
VPAVAPDTAVPQLTVVVAEAGAGTSMAEDQAVLVMAPNQDVYALWHGRRLRLDTADGAQRALGASAVAPVPVPVALLDALPPGPDLAPPDLADRGSPGPALAGRPTVEGQLFTGPSGERYVLTGGKLRPLTSMMFDLLLSDPRTQSGAYHGAVVSADAVGPADLAAYAAVGGDDFPAGLPDRTPQVVEPGPGQGVCMQATVAPTSVATSVVLVDASGLAGRPPAPQPGVAASCTPADRVEIAPGTAVLARALSGAGGGGTDYLVTDLGVKYPIAGAAAVKQLGYPASAAVAVPEGLLAMLPTGPSLDPADVATARVVGPRSAAAPCPG